MKNGIKNATWKTVYLYNYNVRVWCIKEDMDTDLDVC